MCWSAASGHSPTAISQLFFISHGWWVPSLVSQTCSPLNIAQLITCTLWQSHSMEYASARQRVHSSTNHVNTFRVFGWAWSCAMQTFHMCRTAKMHRITFLHCFPLWRVDSGHEHLVLRAPSWVGWKERFDYHVTLAFQMAVVGTRLREKIMPRSLQSMQAIREQFWDSFCWQ